MHCKLVSSILHEFESSYVFFYQKLYQEKVGSPDLIELVKGSGEVDYNVFLPQKVSFGCAEYLMILNGCNYVGLHPSYIR